MSDAVQIALIASIGPILIAAVNAVLQLRHGWKAEKVALKVAEVADAIKVVEKATNGMKAELVAVTRSDATQIERARGAAEVTERNEAAKDQQVERRRQPMVPIAPPMVAVPIATPPTVAETYYVIRNGQLIALPGGKP